MPSTESDDPRPTGGEASDVLLRRAHELMLTRATWTRGHLARDRHSYPVSPTSSRAVRFCAGGALIRAAADEFNLVVRTSQGDKPVTLGKERALHEAYRRLGIVMVELLAPSERMRVHEERRGDLLIPIFSHRKSAADPWIAEAGETTWESVVHTMNDAKTVTHRTVSFCLNVARAIADVPPTIDQLEE